MANSWHSYPVLNGEALKKAIWEIYEDSLIHNTVIHCSAGRGRTGYFLMSLMLLMNYEKVFASENVVDITSEVMKIYKMLREISPLYMLRDNQLGNAVCTSYLAHQYGMALRAKAASEAITQSETTEVQPLRRSASFGDMKQNVAILTKMGSVYTAVVPVVEENSSPALELK
nr:protein-tyrosine phosphatase family protein [Legionella sp. 16cNR16C]